MPELAAWQWLLGALCAGLVGMAKSGLPGLGILAVPLMALIIGDALVSAGWLLPLLIVADAFAILAHHRHIAWPWLRRLVPWVAVGMALAAFVFAALPAQLLNAVIAGLVLIMIALQLRRRYAAPAEAAPPAGRVATATFGVTAGFATTAANAAGPVMHLYLLGLGLPKTVFIGTSACFFGIINLAKVPIFWANDLLPSQTLVFALVLLPLVAAGALSGRAIAAVLPQRTFDLIVLIFAALATVPLLWSVC